MRLFPFRVQAAVVRQPQRHPAQPVMRAGQALFPVQPALRDGAAQRLALHVDTRVGDVGEFGRRYVGHAKAALVLGDDETAGGQPRQGFAQGIAPLP